MLRTANEQGVAGKDGTIISILEQVADAVLGMARCVQRRHFDVAHVESRVVAGRLGHFVTVLAAYDRNWIGFELGEGR